MKTVKSETHGIMDEWKAKMKKRFKAKYKDVKISNLTVRIFKNVKEQGEVAEQFCKFKDNICNAVIFHPRVNGIRGVAYYIQESEEVFRHNLKRAIKEDDIKILNGLYHTERRAD